MGREGCERARWRGVNECYVGLFIDYIFIVYILIDACGCTDVSLGSQPVDASACERSCMCRLTK